MSTAGPARRVTIVAARHREAVALVAAEGPGAELSVLCVEEDGKDGRAALDRALADAERRGCRVAGAPRTVGAPDGGGHAALLRELRTLKPQRVRLADPDPAHVSYDEERELPVHDEPAENADAALAALAAVREHQLESGTPVFVDCHRAGADARPDGASQPRYPHPAHWLTEGFDGRLSAFLPSAAGVVRWTQREPGGTAWQGPELLPGPRLMPGLRVVRDTHGFPHLFALRRIPLKDGGDDIAVVRATQYRTGHPLTPWHSLGSPNSGNRHRSREVGFPAAAFDGTGGLFVFVRNFGHSVSYRHQGADGTWTPWQHLRGVRVADELVTVTTAGGEAELFARARDSAAVLRWYRSGPDGAWTEDRTVPFSPRPGSLAAGPEPGTVLFRDLRTNEPCVWWPGATGPVPLGGADEGAGPVTGVRGVEADGWPYSLLVRSGPGGACAVGVHAEGRADAGVWWNALPADAAVMPAAVRDRAGVVTLATLTAGSQLGLAHRESPSDGFEFGHWYTV
ncbi:MULTISPECIES: hypothetical protein [unclassified Streptomyces]|uniref:hypothetical protein n=1 Tax=unclassified Streptomyces TaxID=2593676 RepID=UPI000F5B989E|nr:hypothetical protein [Streptomyces sp. ADI95-17]RPK63909.1 hypothetical protein EES42_28385 [Streptomyces sp. ADI95-17]WSG54087.1 hypothetical protein OHA38_32205 [Streptomyces sp. NBC_01732]WSX04717.1 hypothetical protein OG355_32175 [Streptomyces sp. NBC_00987]